MSQLLFHWFRMGVVAAGGGSGARLAAAVLLTLGGAAAGASGQTSPPPRAERPRQEDRPIARDAKTISMRTIDSTWPAPRERRAGRLSRI